MTRTNPDGSPDLGGVAPYLRTLLQVSLVYLAIVNKVKIPVWYFVLYAIASFLYLRRLASLSTVESYTKIHGYASLYQMPIYTETLVAAIINTIAAVYLLINKH